ncbi:MAG: hypothetical protein WAX69_01630 [Victivallales bacterium]
MESKSRTDSKNDGTDVPVGQAETPSVEKRIAAELVKFLGGAVQPVGIGGQKSLLPCNPDGKDVSSFGEVGEKLAEAVAEANSSAAGNGDRPFLTLRRMFGKRVFDDLADRSKRPRALTEILVSQIRDNALTCEMLNTSLYSMRQEEISKSLISGKGPLQNTIAQRERCEKSVHAAIEVMNAIDEATYPAVKIRQRRSVKVRMEKPGGKKVTMTGSEMHETKNRQLQ